MGVLEVKQGSNTEKKTCCWKSRAARSGFTLVNCDNCLPARTDSRLTPAAAAGCGVLESV